ncbi:hypothetical protein [Blastococcus sp. TF02-8]|uniref:hypothetical protein n=1 Tax=Blastococcus sp. TF02-8 TaxID=2250574 RepID=UPI0011BEA096|nr:hypothetical protein [Blastococcus sp. TF02-8]
MDPATTTPPPGSMTVPPLFEWQTVAVVVGLAAVVALVVAVALVAGLSRRGRSDWESWLASRSPRGGDRSS